MEGERQETSLEQEWNKLKSTLRSLQYVPLEDAPLDGVLLEDVLCPTALRIHLLSWLLSLLCPSVQQVQSPASVGTAALLELAEVSSTLGFSAPKEIQIIQGCPAGVLDLPACEAQLEFLSNIISFVAFAAQNEPVSLASAVDASSSVLRSVAHRQKKVFSESTGLRPIKPVMLDNSALLQCAQCAHLSGRLPKKNSLLSVEDLEGGSNDLNSLNEEVLRALNEGEEELVRAKNTWFVTEDGRERSRSSSEESRIFEIAQELEILHSHLKEMRKVYSQTVSLWISAEADGEEEEPTSAGDTSMTTIPIGDHSRMGRANGKGKLQREEVGEWIRNVEERHRSSIRILRAISKVRTACHRIDKLGGNAQLQEIDRFDDALLHKLADVESVLRKAHSL